MKYIFLFIILSCFVYGDVVISQVLYDPIGTESGGEAVELKNLGDIPVDVSGWILATESSGSDAVIPKGAVIQAGSSYLIADIGWNVSRDDLDWRLADFEESITLKNSDGGVALIDGEEVIDAVGWGDVESIDVGLFEGVPAVIVKAGKSLLRLKDSGDNSLDFVESVADFLPGFFVPIFANVSVSIPILEMSDSLSLNPEGSFFIRNNGASSFSVKLFFNDLYFKDNVISKDFLSVDGPSEFVLEAFSEFSVKVRIKSFAGVVPGSYSSSLRILLTEN